MLLTIAGWRMTYGQGVGLFTGTSESYRRFRPGVPPAVAAVLEDAVRTREPVARLLDLGTGPGFVVSAIGHAFSEIVAVDPDAELLQVAREDLSQRHDLTVRFVHGTAEDFALPPGWRADLVTICRAFHWMDQPRVLERLDGMVEPGGAVAVFGEGGFWTSTTPWKQEMRLLIQELLGTERRAGEGSFVHHSRPYVDILRESAFHQLEQTTFPVSRTRTVESVIGYLHSTSFAAPHLFGERLDDFQQEARRRLAAHAEDGELNDRDEFALLIARRGDQWTASPP